MPDRINFDNAKHLSDEPVNERIDAIWEKDEISPSEYFQLREHGYPSGCRDLVRGYAADDRQKKMLKDCDGFGLSSDLVLLAITFDEDHAGEFHEAQATLCLELMRRLENWKRLKKETNSPTRFAGEMPESLIKDVVFACYDACYFDGIVTSYDLRVLLTDVSNREGKRRDAPKDSGARNLAALILAGYPEIKDRELARKLGIDHTTIGRWKKEEEFQKMIKDLGSVKNIPDSFLERLKDN